MSTTLYLLRHGPTAAPAGTFIGSTDVELSGQGLERLVGLVPRLNCVQSWYCSPMRRSRQTLEAMEGFGCPVGNVQYDDRLREMDFGRWEQKSFPEIAASDSELVKAWEQYEGFVFPGGERVMDFLNRVREMLELLATANYEQIGVMTHGGVIRTMVCLALGIEHSNYLLFDVQPASMTVLQLFDQGGVLQGLNL